ncbi:hypothetical protein [Deminuibacter soli]|uniref:Uncharacterized protein n=1 Tax=Deminuibacter soli TaxID=2291815 RepID=A0A3E1NFZ7_9BACT|nr:hypothetical protein [Deminuibacter soli]RFM26718.1 hypothetical protein DXN05_19310 [Deminuibacter soli]
MSIKITIKKNSKAHEAIKRMMAEKDAFRKAIKSGDDAAFFEKYKDKISTPVKLNHQPSC